MSKNNYDQIASALEEDAAVLDEDIDLHRNFPKPDPACLYGLVGEIAKAGSSDTEANIFAVGASALAYLGVAIGRGTYLPIGDDVSHTRLFFVHVGRSNRGRKGTAKKLVFNRIASAIEKLDEGLAPKIHVGGLSTREGIAALIHDGRRRGTHVEPAIKDKRLLVIESEFVNILKMSRRPGNTLTTAVRDLWDGISLMPATKHDQVWATDPHVGIIADITPSELMDSMKAGEITNGFANRFIFFWAEANVIVPFPKRTEQPVIDDFAIRIKDILEFVGANRHTLRDTYQFYFSPEAKVIYENLYKGELRINKGSERINALLDRRAPMLLRLSMIFALTDKTLQIDVPHINAAMGWIRYWVDSVLYIFQSDKDEEKQRQITTAADKILAFVNVRGEATRTELSKKCFAGHTSKSIIDGALDDLLARSPSVIEIIEINRTASPGSPTKVYRPTANSAKSANREQPSGFEKDLPSASNVRSLRNMEP
jgi:hypothetical protein